MTCAQSIEPNSYGQSTCRGENDTKTEHNRSTNHAKANANTQTPNHSTCKRRRTWEEEEKDEEEEEDEEYGKYAPCAPGLRDGKAFLYDAIPRGSFDLCLRLYKQPARHRPQAKQPARRRP